MIELSARAVCAEACVLLTRGRQVVFVRRQTADGRAVYYELLLSGGRVVMSSGSQMELHDTPEHLVMRFIESRDCVADAGSAVGLPLGTPYVELVVGPDE